MSNSKSISTELLVQFLEQSVDAIAILDSNGEVLFWNNAAQECFGYEFEEIIGKQVLSLIVLDPRADLLLAFESWVAGRAQPATMEWQAKTKSGKPIWVEQSLTRMEFEGQTVCVLNLRNIDVRKSLEEKLHREAKTDALSELLNRRGFQHLLEAHLGQPLTLAIIDIDSFKAINDDNGHPAGDEAIRCVAGFLSESFPDAICLGRLGGDEFGVVIATTEKEKTLADFESFREKIVNSQFSKIVSELSVSIGVAFSQRTNVPARKLLTLADQSMYESKTGGKNRITITELD